MTDQSVTSLPLCTDLALAQPQSDGYADPTMLANGFEIATLDTKQLDVATQQFTQDMWSVNPLQKANAMIEAGFQQTLQQIAATNAVRNQMVSAKCTQIALAAESHDVAEVHKRMSAVDKFSDQIQQLEEDEVQSVQRAISNGLAIASSGVQSLVAGQTQALALSQKQMTTYADAIGQAHRMQVDAQCYRFLKQNQSIASAIEVQAKAKRIMKEEQAAGTLAEAKGRTEAALCDATVRRQQVADDHQASVQDLDLEKQKDENENHREQMEQRLQQKTAADQQQLEAERQQHKIEHEQAKLDLHMKKEADDYSRLDKEFDKAMKAYNDEYADAIGRCWGSGRGYKITAVAPKIAKREDGTRYVTAWSVGYVPR